MHVLHELVCGIRGAELGTVDIYRRGTSTRVTYYTSFEGDGSTTPTAATTLDANGGGEFYVNETCDVVVRDSGGTEVRRFTSAPAASAVEVISQSFTGTDYDSGVSAATKPLALSTALDRLYTSFGALDFNVLFNGASSTLQAALAGVGSLYFNVKSPSYGAVGDGVAADRAPAQAAIDAASAAGGGIVFFPKGTYLITGTLNVPDKVMLLGVGAAASIIRLATDAGLGLVSYAASTYRQTIDSLRFDAAVATSRSMIFGTGGELLVIRNCYFGGPTFTGGGVGSSSAASEMNVFYSTFETSGTAISTTNGAPMRLIGCKFVFPATYNSSMVNLGTASLSGTSVLLCEFDTSAMSAGTGNIFTGAGNAGKCAVIMGCEAANPAGGTLSLWAGPGINDSGTDGILILGNKFGSSIVRSALWGEQATATTYRGSFDMERERARYYTADDTAAVAISAMIYATATVKRTTTGAQTVTVDGPGPTNHTFTLVYYVAGLGAPSGTITMAGNVKGLTTFTVNDNSFSMYTFKSVHVQTTKFWTLVGSSVNQTP